MCPNIGECWGAGTATIMILGDTCTRGCHFCNVKTGSPQRRGRLARAQARRRGGRGAGLEVSRSDGGRPRRPRRRRRGDLRQHRAHDPQAGRPTPKSSASPAISPATWRRSTSCSTRGPRCSRTTSKPSSACSRPCATAARTTASRSASSSTRSTRGNVTYTKTSLMLGLGETEAEIAQAMDDARAIGVDIFTMGQYLQPTKRHLPVEEFVTPEKFARLEALGDAKGFVQVVSSPLSRSSYHAEQAFVVAPSRPRNRNIPTGCRCRGGASRTSRSRSPSPCRSSTVRSRTSRCRRSRASSARSPAESIWVVNGFQLAVTASLLPSPRWAAARPVARLSRRRDHVRRRLAAVRAGAHAAAAVAARVAAGPRRSADHGDLARRSCARSFRARSWGARSGSTRSSSGPAPQQARRSAA